MHPLFFFFFFYFPKVCLASLDGMDYCIFFYSFCSTEESSTEVNISANEIHPGAETKVTYLSQFRLTFNLMVWNVFLN